MITSQRIERTLKFLDAEYNSSLLRSDQEVPVLFAKMAILEYCGWLELTFDEITRNCVRGKLRTISARKLLEDKITATHGFTYRDNFRPLLAYGLGVIKLKKVESRLNRNGDLATLKSNLGSLNKMRREAAHTYTSGRTSRFDAPSTIIANFGSTKPVLVKLWSFVRED